MLFTKSLKSLPPCLLGMASLAQPHPTAHQLVKHNVGTNESAIPRNFGVVLFRAFAMEDVAGIVDPLQVLAHSFPMNLYMLAETLDPVTTEPEPAGAGAGSSSFWPRLVPTHTFADAPGDIEVLIVPGGPGTRSTGGSSSSSADAAADYIRGAYPGLRYLVTVCTGAGLAARAGVLDGRRATTNKASWDAVTAMGPRAAWVSPARWVVDGNIWSSSGVTAGIDLAFAWISEIWGPEWADRVAGIQEYVPHPQDFDPFAAKYNVTPTGEHIGLAYKP